MQIKIVIKGIIYCKDEFRVYITHYQLQQLIQETNSPGLSQH